MYIHIFTPSHTQNNEYLLIGLIVFNETLQYVIMWVQREFQ